MGSESGIALSCSVGQSHGSDAALLWRRPAAAAPIRTLAWELPYATHAPGPPPPQKKQEKKMELKKKNLGVNLTKEVKSLYAKNYKTLKKETEDDSKYTCLISELIKPKHIYFIS